MCWWVSVQLLSNNLAFSYPWWGYWPVVWFYVEYRSILELISLHRKYFRNNCVLGGLSMHRLAVECGCESNEPCGLRWHWHRQRPDQTAFQMPATQQIVNVQLVPEILQDLNQTGYYVQHIAAERRAVGIVLHMMQHCSISQMMELK